MNLIDYIFLTVFIVVVYLITIDKNVADYLLLLPKILKVYIDRFRFMLILHPMNPIENWKINRRANRIARELQKEFSIKDTP
jgi:ABC-type multidrug transport system fused ATPase/permease subunit